MAVIIPNAWSENSAYAVDDLTYYFGTVYRCVTAVPENTDGNPIPVMNDDWVFEYIVRIEDYYSLQESIRVAINTDDQIINDSIPLFIQEAEHTFNKILRSPAQIVTQELDVDSEGRVKIPNDLLQIIHVRNQSQEGAGFSLASRGAVVIEACDKMEYEDVIQQFDSNFRGTYLRGQVLYPVYWSDGEYLWIAPKPGEDEKVEVSYYQAVPALGTIGLAVNDSFEAVNNQNMTLQEWIDAGNPADSFIQAEVTVLRNLWTSSIPNVLKLGAIKAAETYLSNDERLPVWSAQYDRLIQETVTEYQAYETQRQFSQTMEISYFSV